MHNLIIREERIRILPYTKKLKPNTKKKQNEVETLLFLTR